MRFAWSEGEEEDRAGGEEHAGGDEEDVGALRGRVAGVERFEIGGPPGAAVGGEGGFGLVDVRVALRADDGAGDSERASDRERGDPGGFGPGRLRRRRGR